MQIRRESIVRAPAARVWRILGEEFMSVAGRHEQGVALPDGDVERVGQASPRRRSPTSDQFATRSRKGPGPNHPAFAARASCD